MALRLEAIIGLNSHEFERGIDRVKESVAETAKGFIIGALGVYSIEQAIDKTIETAEELVNTSKNLSLTVEQLQVMKQAAKESGIEFQTMTSALQRFNAVRENVLRGGKGSVDQMAALGRLGLTREDLEKQNSGQSVMGQISATAQKSNAADIAKDLRDVFGKGGAALFGTLQTNFEELETSMKSVGAIMDSTTAHELKAFKDEMDLIGAVITSSLAPYLVKFGAVLYDTITLLGLAGTTLGTIITDWIHGRFKGSLDDVKEEGNKFVADRKSSWDEMVSKASRQTPPPLGDIEENELTKKERKDKSATDKIASDSLVKVGNFIGSNHPLNKTDRAERHAVEMISHLEHINRTLEKLARENGLVGNRQSGWVQGQSSNTIPVN